MWLRMAKAAVHAGTVSEFGPAFLAAKLRTARFFASRHLPETAALRTKVEAGSALMMGMAPGDF